VACLSLAIITDIFVSAICRLAGLSAKECTDDAAVAPLKPDLAYPTRDLYQGNASFPSLDGQDMWNSLMQGGNGRNDDREIVLSAEVLIQGRYKLIVAQPDPKLINDKSENLGWKGKDGKWEPAPGSEGCDDYRHRSHFQPCLFDVVDDIEERKNLARLHPEIVESMWKRLNQTLLTRFTSGNGMGSPSQLLGKCKTEKQAKKKWGGNPGPLCGWDDV